MDGPIAVGDILAVIGYVGLLLSEQSQPKKIVSNISTDTIGWEAGDKNHILKGTKRKHVNGWKRFGIDPDNDNAWSLLLPILEEVVDGADSIESTVLANSAMIVQCFKTKI